jgi:hypothetical protein
MWRYMPRPPIEKQIKRSYPGDDCSFPQTSGIYALQVALALRICKITVAPVLLGV